MHENLIIEGLKFMLLGMGTVFLFLAFMIVVMNIQSKIIHKFFPEPLAADTSSPVDSSDQKRKIAAITAAIMHHRNS
jgi:oxaloacetate decarboxylase gamma subunit